MPTVSLLVRRIAGRPASHAGVSAQHDPATDTFTIAAAAVSFAPAIGDTVRIQGKPDRTRTVTAVAATPDGAHVLTAPAPPKDEQ